VTNDIRNFSLKGNGMLEWLIMFTIAAAGIACLTWGMITDWIEENKTLNSRIAQLVKEHLENGDVTIIANLLDDTGKQTASNKWTGSSFDHDLLKKFGRNNTISISI
jgi:hypothetical protein